ncbi:MAG: NAD-dependent epimerase/dehydratase family protein [Dokdonia sp.]|jgi:nucleoside-diphosphate-sugar epimerase
MKKIIVMGAGGFIGSHLVKKLKSLGHWVKGIDLKYPEFSESLADEFVIGDLRLLAFCQEHITDSIDEIYQLAADMGGAGYLFTGENDFDVVHNSALINLNVAKCAIDSRVDKIFFSSSACIYPKVNQQDPNNPNCEESSAYPAEPDSEYGWEKLFAERLYTSANRNYHINIRIARFHNVYGPEGTFDSGKEKVPAALCRKVAMAKNNETIEIWGKGTQTRSFLYIDDCIEGVIQLMDSNYSQPLNIGSEEMISINELANLIIDISNKSLGLSHIEGPVGVQGRTSNNDLVKSRLGWQPKIALREGLEKTYQWITTQVVSTTATV